MATSDARSPQQDLEAAITRHRDEVVHFVRARAGGLLRFEGATDLVSGLVVELLSRIPDFEARGPDADRAWLFEAARLHLANRRRYWGALKRETSRLLRTGMQGGSQTGEGSDFRNGVEGFAASQTGPSTFAFRREQLVLLTQAIAVLLPRDRRLVELVAADRTNEEIASELGLAPAAAAKAKARALDRLRKAHELASRRGTPPQAS